MTGLLLLPQYLIARSNTNLNPAKETILVFPSQVSAVNWNNVQTIGQQDLRNTSLFQEFDKTNSAYIGTDVDSLTPTIESSNSSTAPVNVSGSEVVDEVITSESLPSSEGQDSIPISEPQVTSPVILEETPLLDEGPSMNDALQPVEAPSVSEPIPPPAPSAEESIEAPVELDPTSEPVSNDAEVSFNFVLPNFITSNYSSGVFALLQAVTTTPVTNAIDTSFAIDENAEPAQGVTSETIIDQPSVPNNSITLSGFGVPKLASGQFIENLQLRLSLAGQYGVDVVAEPAILSANYSFGKFEGSAGGVLLEEEFSNALNGGYYVLSLPSIQDASLLSDLEITLSFSGDSNLLNSLYIDSVWLEVATVVYNDKLLKERILPEKLNHLSKPIFMEFMSKKVDFTRSELPSFSLKYNSQRNFITQAFRSLFGGEFAKVDDIRFYHNGLDEVAVHPELYITEAGLISINISDSDRELLKPGEYTVEIDIAEGDLVSSDSFEFQWGLLSINTNQTEYTNGDIVHVSMGALSPNGNTVCNANLNLFVTDPRGYISSTPVVESGQCFGNNVIDVPDYSTEFAVEEFGLYELYLERVDDNGDIISHTLIDFSVVPNQDIVIERNGPTRIFPPAPYTVDLSVHGLKRSFDGEVIEIVPSSFEIFNTDAEIRQGDGFTELVWKMSMLSGNTETVSYTFDAPDISPYLFNLGPARLVTKEEVVTTSMVEVVDQNASSTASSTPVFQEVTDTSSIETIIFEEHRQWQIASDAIQAGYPVIVDTPAFDNLLSTTTTPLIGGFVGLDDTNANAIEYELQIDDNYDFSSPATTTNSSNFPSDAGWSAATFANGATTSYAIQAADALTNGTTYFWRVRARDTTNGGWTAYSEPRSITIDTASLSSAWYQTLGPQFNKGTLTNRLATTTGGVTLAADAALPRVESGWTSNTAVPGASLTLTKPSGVEPGDLLLILVGNDIDNAGQQWGGANSPAGFTLINEAGNNTSDAHAAAFYRVADGTEQVSTSTTALSSADYWGFYIRVTGVDPNNPIEVTGADYNSGNTLGKSIPSVTTSASNTLAFYILAADGADTDPFSVTGPDWIESAEIEAGTGVGNAAGTWGTRAMVAPGATTNAAVTMSANDGASGFQFALKPLATTTGTILSSEIDFDWVPNQNAWGDITWNVNEPTGTDTFLRVYYSNVTACDTLVPDIDLPGNSAGFDASDSNLYINGLSTTTYNRICLQMKLDHATGPTPPTLNDWRVRFDLPDQAPVVPTLEATPAFDNLLATSTPTLGAFWSTDFELDDMEYEIVIDNDYNFSSPVLTKNSSNFPTDAGWSSATFTAGASTTYNIQPADALTNGTTYFWKVRARDPGGSNTWGEYSELRSLTINTGAEQLGWHQTLGYQFQQGTLFNLSTTTNGVVLTNLGSAVSTTTESFEALADGNTTFVATTIWKQASITADDGNWQAETTRTQTNNTGPNAASAGTVFIYTEASAGGACDNTIANNNCAIEADIEDSTLDGIQFDYHMWGTNIGTLSLDVYDGATWTTVWTRTGAQSTGALDWINSGYVDLSAYKATTTAIRFFADGNGAGFLGDFALDDIRIATSTLAVGTIMSPEIDHSFVPAENYWGMINWDVTEPVGTNSLLKVYYSNVSTCDTLVPDAAIPGNSTGFSLAESGVIINTISTTTYDRLCLQMTLSQGTGTTSPILNDWTVDWIVPQQVPLTPVLSETPTFDNYKSTTTAPQVGGFVTTDYEEDVMEYQIVIDNDYDFSSPTLTKQSSNYPTDAGWSAATFAAGATTTYSIQPADALINGTTYYWKVRARDPGGSNTWSDYSEVRSITISNAVSVPEWFQATDEQFNSNLQLTNATTTGTGGVTINDGVTSVSLLDAWSTGNTKTISSGENRLLVVSVTSEDSATNSNVNTVTYGGQTLTEITDQQIGTGFSNGMWVGYLDEAGIAAAAGTTITPTWVGGTPSNGILYTAVVYENVNQTTPLRGFSGNALTSGTTITPSSALDVSSGDVMFYITESAQNLTHTAATNYTEATEQTTGGSGFTVATAYREITSASSEFPEAIWSGSGNRLLMVAVALQPTPAVATIVSSEIDFDWVPNQDDWGEILWHVNEPSGSDTRLRVYYTNAIACDTIVPDGALPGNSAGFQSGGSPTDISGLSTTTYNRICLEMTLVSGPALSFPTLSDWSVSWQLSSVYEQSGFWWYNNTNAITPTDPWPPGGTNLAENAVINSFNPTKTGDVLRLRMGVGVSGQNSSGASFKLQYAAGETCTTELDWFDVAPISSTTALWRGYNNAGVSDGATLPSAILSATDRLETYEEENNSSLMPNTINIGEFGEWDWVLQNQAAPGTPYCFRMVTPDGNRFKTYTNYPQLITNQSPTVALNPVPFDNEKLASTSPWFEFTGVDPEGESIDYQIQIDNDADFSSAVADHNSVTNSTYFENRIIISDKSPFNDSQEIRYITPNTLIDGTTYWWRVRAVDTNGSTIYGEWTTPKSFTIDTSVTISTWFQTTEEQFDTNTLVGTDATAGDLVAFASGSTTGTTTSSLIDFDWVTIGNAWGQFSFTDTGAANDILYRIEYFNGSDWVLIPDGDLSGNAAGYDTSPVDLINLDTETYNQIRVRANFNSGSPTLIDWTVSWGLRVSVPTHLLLFDNEKTGTTTPDFTFFTTDPDGDDLEYEFSWSTDNTFLTGSTTVNSSTSPGFLNVDDGGDGNPFTSGDTINYKMQSPLTNGVTYWWRTRAKDPYGGNAYSFWSNPWSFTVDTTATTSTWFQTTEEQFDTDTLLGLVSLAADSVTTVPASVSVYNFAGVTNPSATHVARDFEIDVNDPTDPPTVDAIDTITVLGTSASTPNLRTGIAGYGSDAEATNLQYTNISASDDVRWTISNPGPGDNAVFWAQFDVTENPVNIDQIEVTLEGYQGAATDVAWLGIWRPGATIPYWQALDWFQQTVTDGIYSGTITTNIEEYLDANNKIHIIFFNENVNSTLLVDYVEVVVTSNNTNTGTLTGTSLDYDDGNGPAWGQMYWSDNEPGSSSIHYQLEYLNGVGAWELIPDTALTGNSTGFTTSPVDIKLLNTTTYNEIRPVANFTCVAADCPTLNDWTIEWSRGFSVSGTAYEYDGVTPTVGGTVEVAVNGVLQAGKTASIGAGGNWTINNVTFFAGDVVTVFVSGATDANEAVGITKYDGTPDITGMRLQKGHLTLGSNDNAIITSADIALYDFTNDEDIFFDVNGSNVLNMCADVGCSENGLIVLANNTFTPSANITTHDVNIYGTLTAGAYTHRVSGSWTNTGTTTMTGSTVIMTATSTSESINTTGATLGSFNNLTFGEGSGTATWSLANSLDVNGNLLVTYGTLARGVQDISIAGAITTAAGGFWTGIGTTTVDATNPTNWTDSNAVKQNVGYMVVDGSSKALVLQSDVAMQSLTIGANDIFNLNGRTATVYEGWINNNTFTSGIGTVIFAATNPGQIITVGSSSFYNLVFNGVGGSWSFTGPNLGVTNDFTVATGTVTLPTATTTIGGSFNATGGTFAHNNGTLLFNSPLAETLTFDGDLFANTVYNLTFSGSGSWTINDANATSSNDVRVTQGTINFPTGVMAIGGSLSDTGGAYVGGTGTVLFYSGAAEVITAGGSSFNNVIFDGAGSWSFSDTTADANGDLSVLQGSLTLPSSIFTLGGSYTNSSSVIPGTGTLTFDSSDTGETVDFGASSLYNVVFNSPTGGWTISTPATTTNNFAITAANNWTLASGQLLSVGGIFTNSVGGASTTWNGSTLSLEAGNYSINSKSNPGDVYDTLRVPAGVAIAMWNSAATTYNIDTTASLYSQDHNAIDGDLYIFGSYVKTGGTEYWSYATDFDGTVLGGSSRQVDVSFAAGASADFTNSLLNITGSAAASTTIGNQGTGTYVIDVSGGTTTAQYYEFSDLGATGLSLLDSAIVPLLRDGNYHVAAPGGTALTLSSTTIDANPGKQIFGVTFATSSAISAFNVTQTDGAPVSFWWFREGFGNLYGEAYDNDTGDPGSVRFDDSSLTISVAGTVYSDAGITPITGGTCDGVTPVVRVVVNGGTSYTGSCSNIDGTYSISGVAVVGDPTLTVYLDNSSGGEKGSVVTRTPTGNILNLDIYANRVIVRNEDVAATTIENLAVYDFNNDADLRFIAETTTEPDSLTVLAGNELFIFASSTFTPSGNVTLNANAAANSYDGTLYIDDDATFAASATSTYTIGGRLVLGAGSVFAAASSTVLMNATTTGKSITAPALVTFHDLQFDGTGGGWNLGADIEIERDMTLTNGTVTGTGDITLNAGSLTGNGVLSLGSGTTTMKSTNTLGGTSAWTFYNLQLGDTFIVGTTTPVFTATTTVAGRLTISSAHYLDAGATAWDLTGAGTVFIENGTFIQDTSTIRYSGAGSNVLSTQYYNLDINSGFGNQTYIATGLGIIVDNDLTIGGDAPSTFDLNLNDPALDVNGDVVIHTNGTLSASNSASLTIAGNYDNGGILNNNGGTFTFDGSGSTNIAAGASSFGNVLINSMGDVTVSEHATTTGTFTLSNANTFTVASSQVLAVGGTFLNSVGGAATTWTGSTLSLYGGNNYTINATTTSDTYDSLSVGGTTQIRMWNSDATTYTVPGTASLYSQDHSGVDGDLYIWGGYRKSSGSDHWSYTTDFDGTSLVGSPRKVDVYFASGANANISGGSLGVYGISTASTTIQNQGSGTYGLVVGGNASTTFNYYEIRDINSNGLVLTGTPSVKNISNGDLEVSQNGGTAITVGGTVITANPAKNFTLNRFALNGVASGFNVTATGTTVSSWRFVSHYGDIDGEAFDVDPDGDPGYITWDDSAALITVSGNVYSDEGTTVSGVCDGVTNNVTLRVAGITSYSTACNGGTGAYSISGVSYGPTDSLVVYIDGETQKGAVVTKEPVSNINNLHIYENRVIVRNESADPINIADMAVWDSSDDADIPFTAVDAGTDTLTLPANYKLIVWNGKEFEPTGNVTLSGGGAGAAYDGTLQMLTGSTWTGQGTESLSIGGSMILDNAATFNASNGTTTFTTSGAARTIDVNENPFHNIAFTGSGSWNITDATLAVDGNFRKTAGALTLPAGTSTFNGSFINLGGTFNANGGRALFTGASTKTITLGGSDLATVEFVGGNYVFGDINATTTGSTTISSGNITLPSGTFSIGGDFLNLGGSFTHNTSELIFTNATAASLLAAGSDLFAVTWSGGGAYRFEDNSLALLDSLFILSGDVIMASGTMSIGGSFDATGGTFSHSTGTLLFNSADGGEFIDSGVSNFYNVQISAPTGGYTVTGNATTTNNFSIASANSFTLQSGRTLKVEGVFLNSVGGTNTTWTGSTLSLDGENAYTINTKSNGADQYDTLVVGTNSDIRFWNSAATTTVVAGSASVYSQDHAGVNGNLNIYGDFHVSTTTEYWSYATDFDGTSLSGSERVVTVAHASNATTTVDGGILNIIGVSGNVTTVTNQGSGTYAFEVNDGTFNAQYYAYRNLNATGLNLSGTPTITSLSYGDFELAVNGGSLITLSSATLDANASKYIVGNRFATTSAITGYNVYLTSSTSNAWTFASHTGNLDGEDFDSDGLTACGSIRWADSACLLTQQTEYRWRNDNGGLGVPDNEWYDINWAARKRVKITNYDATTYTDATVQLFVTYDADMQADFDDLRFTDASGTTSIPYWIGSTTNSVVAEVWVKLPSLLADDTANIFMYYNNPTATTTSSSTDTFIAADDFEDGNITEYSGQTSLFSANTNFNYSGLYGLDNNGNETARANLGGIFRFDQTVSQGETFRYLQYVDTGAGSGDEVCTLFGVQSPGTTNQNYAVCLEQFGTDRISLVKDVVDNDNSGTILASSTITYATGWYEVEVDWGTDDSINVSVYDVVGTLVATTSATDSAYTSGGFGFTFWFNNGGWDSVSSRKTISTEPGILFGVEQTDGGATWRAEQNTPASYSLGNVARLRVVVENSGLNITNQQFQLEYAPLGVSPSCEAVSGAAYVTVPPQASCGTSPVCMVASPNFINNSPTVDLLLGTAGSFTAGEAIEDPSNKTANLNINQNFYTEIEYALTPTANTIDNNLCFRVTNNGTDLDTYLSVARMPLSFDPVVGAITLNGGADISLLPGTTTRVYATGTVSDANGYTDMVVATSTFFRTTVPGGAACTPDNNNCYVSATPSQCQFINCAGNSCTLQCYADIYFHADPTDIGSPLESDEWFAYVEIEDAGGGYDGETSIAQELLTLRAIDVNGLIDYGALAVNTDTGSYNASTSVLNEGNVEINIQIAGTDLFDGVSSIVPANEQKFSTSTFTYSSCGATCALLSSTTPVAIDVDLAKPSVDDPPVSDDVYWGIAIPFGVNSVPHQGINVFTPVSP